MYGKGTYEDVDLCMKVRQLGNRIYIDTDAVAYHYVGATVEKQQQGYSLQNNNMLYKAKWASTGMFVYDEWTYR
jgi:GT2 family glycosyltransferase